MVAKCGYNQNSSLAMLFGPTQLGGASFFRLYDLQGFGQMYYFLKHWRSPKASPGKMLRIAVSWLQFCAGISTSVFTDTDLPLVYLESNYLTSLRQCLKDIPGSFHLLDDMVPPRQRANNVYLMEIAIQCGKFGPKDLRRLNHCRLWLNVVMLADVANAAGTQVEDKFYFAKRIERDEIGCRKGRQANQFKPNEKAWKVWRRLLNKLCVTRYQRRHLRPMGQWLVPPAQMRRSWPFWINPTHPEVLFAQHKDGTFTAHPRLMFSYDAVASGAPDPAVFAG